MVPMFFWTNLFLWTLVSIGYTNAGTGMEMIFKNFSCTSEDPKGYLQKLSCFLNQNLKRRTFSIEMQFKKDVSHFTINSRVELPRKDAGNFVLLNLTNMDGCNWLSNKNPINLLKIGRSLLDRYGNMPRNCPFKKGIRYYISRLRSDISSLPAFAFETDMLIWFDIVVDRNKLIKGFLKSSLTMTKNNKNENGR